MVRILAALLLLTQSAIAETDGRSYIDLVFDLGESRFELANHILRSSADFIASDEEMSAGSGHRGLKQIIGEDSPFRSVLAIDRDGQLMFDSYNWAIFTPVKDLSQREYFRSSTNEPGKEMQIFSPVVGKQSGRYFVPIAMGVPNGADRNQKVVVLTAPPEAFLPSQGLCNYCGVILLKDGRIIASSVPMSEVNEDVASRMLFDGAYGSNDLRIRGMLVTISWRRSSKTDIVYAFYEAKPDPSKTGAQ